MSGPAPARSRPDIQLDVTSHPLNSSTANTSASSGATNTVTTTSSSSSTKTATDARMPAVGAHPAFYDPDAPPAPPPAAMDYAQFMLAQQQQQQQQQMSGFGHGNGEYGLEAGYAAYDGMDVGFGRAYYSGGHHLHHQHQQQQQAHPHPHPQHAHQFTSVSPASGSTSTHSLPSTGAPAAPGQGQGQFYYDGPAFNQQQQQQQQQQYATHGLPSSNFDLYFPPSSAASGFDSFPASAGTGPGPGSGTPDAAPVWSSAAGVGDGAALVDAPYGQGQGQKEKWSRSAGAAGTVADGTTASKRPGRSATVRASPAQQKQGQAPGRPQKPDATTAPPPSAATAAAAPTSATAARHRNRAKRARAAVEASDSDGDSDDDVSFSTATAAPPNNILGGSSFPSWSTGMGGTAHFPPGAAALAGSGGTGNGGGWSGLGIPGLTASMGGGNGRLPGACTHCKKLKMKCEFPQGDNVCKRCKAGGHACVVEGRKPRSAPNKREYLLAQIRQKDAIIESLLKQLHNPYMATPLSIAAYRMASSPSDAHGSRNVLQWLERLQQSAQNQPGIGASGRAARALERHARRRQTGVDGEDVSDSDADDEQQDHQQQQQDGADGIVDGGGPMLQVPAASGTGTPKTEPDASAVSETLRQNDSLLDDAVPIGLLANLSISNHAGRAKERSRTRSEQSNGGGSTMGSVKDLESEGDDSTNVGVANETYFMPGPASDLHVRKMLIERHSPPEILVHGLVNEEDVERLFEIFYEKVNPFLSLLDPVLHTPASTFARCPFLFTVVCAISSRYYREKAEIYAIAMHFAKHAAATALIDGWKSVELCQAYILMAVYAVPARRWEEDRSWLYIGLAIRLATDLNLHQASSARPTSDRHEREILNRTRVWMICFNLDRSTATQFGKPSTIKEDFIIRNSKDWYKRSKYNHPYDIHLCAYSSLLRIVAKFHEELYSDKDSPNALNQNLDFRAVTLAHDARLEEYFVEWTQKFKEDSDPEDKACKYRCTLLPFLTNYSRLVMFSFGFQQAYRRGFRAGDELFFNKCMDSATNVIKAVIDVLAPSGYLRYAPDGHFVFASFASAFLLKLLRPEFSNLVTKEQTNQIFALIGKLIQVLASSDVSIDDRHTPKLYARFLAGLLAKHQPGGPSSGRLHPTRPSDSQMPDSGGHGGAGSMHTGSGPSQGVFHANTGSQGGTSPSHGTTQRGLNASGPAVSASAPDVVSHTTVPSPLSMSSTPMDTPIYEADATYAIGTGPLELSSSNSAMQFGFGGFGAGIGPGGGYGAMQEEEMLATMHAIKNPAFWEGMMMPGFVWPDTAHPPPYQAHSDYILGPIPQQMPLHG